MEKITKKEFINSILNSVTHFFYTGYRSIKEEEEQKKFISNFIEEHQKIKTTTGRTATGNSYKIKFSDGSVCGFEQVGKDFFFKDRNFLICEHVSPDDRYTGQTITFLLYKIINK